MTHHILLIGGHGKVSQLLTPLLLARSWNVTSMIRSSDQVPTIEKLGKGQPGKLDVLVSSVEDVKSEGDAREILERVGPDWVVWSAGSGGKGGPSRTLAVDGAAAIAFTKASIATPRIKKFLNVSYSGSRHSRAPWWNDEEWAATQQVNNDVLATYYKAKVAADEVLIVLSRQREQDEAKRGVPADERFHGISLRPSWLTDKPAGGISFGKTRARGENSRALVAEAVARVLETRGARGWLDMLEGEDEVGEAVEKAVRDGVDCFEGEDWEAVRERVREL